MPDIAATAPGLKLTDEAFLHHTALERGGWRLDNAAIIMPAVSGGRDSSLFRISFTLDEAVERERLDRALRAVATRFPYFDVELRRGFFWYRLAPCAEPPRATADSPRGPCQGFDPNRKGTRLYRIRVDGSRISGEFSHIIADGRGGIRFMKTLLAEYLRLGGEGSGGGDPDIYRLQDKPAAEECEDAYVRYRRPGLPLPDTGKKAFRLSGDLVDEGDYRVTLFRLPLADAITAAKKRGATLTELVAAIYLDCLQELWLEAPPEGRKRGTLAVEIPVDLRRWHRTATNRNFALFVVVNQDMGLGPRGFDELLERLKLQFRYENDERSLARQVSRNVGGMLHPLIRAIPLPLKDLGAKVLFKVLGEDQVSGVVTNLGPLGLPPGFARKVKRFELVQPPSTATKANLAIHSFGDELYVSVGSILRSRRLEELVAARLASLGFACESECNFD